MRWKKRFRFPAASVWASGMKAVAAKSGGRMERRRFYVPQELGVPALHTSGGVEGGEAAHCAPLRMSSSPAMWAEAYRSIASIVWQVAEKRDWMP